MELFIESRRQRRRLIQGLREQAQGRYFLAEHEGELVGVAICFLGFSTFRARPLLNIHDLAVRSDFRGQGVGSELLRAVERAAREEGCCRLTLEVHARNRARQLYHRHGFEPDAPEDEFLFLIKALE